MPGICPGLPPVLELVVGAERFETCLWVPDTFVDIGSRGYGVGQTHLGSGYRSTIMSIQFILIFQISTELASI